MIAHSQAKLPPLVTIRDILKLYRLNALKNLSQNFLLNERLINKFVKAAGRIGDGEVCEVGPGPGGITRSILYQCPKRVIVIEKDERFKPVLEYLADAATPEVKIILGDVMNFDMSHTFNESVRNDWDDQPPNIHLIGNLPFNVSTPLIVRWLKCISERSSAWSYGRVKMTLTFQKEVAERIVAPILSKHRCRLSVMCQNWCKVDHRFTIRGSAFLPKPDVDVGVVHFVPLVKPIIPLDFKLVEKLLRTIFGFRQKYSIKGARRLFPPEVEKDLGEEMYSLAQLDPQVRAFQITNEEFGRLCHAYKFICDREPHLYHYEHRACKEDSEKFYLDWEKSKGAEESENVDQTFDIEK